MQIQHTCMYVCHAHACIYTHKERCKEIRIVRRIKIGAICIAQNPPGELYSGFLLVQCFTPEPAIMVAAFIFATMDGMGKVDKKIARQHLYTDVW